MCGLTGFFLPSGFDPVAAATQATAMALRITHRGPDDTGVWVDGDVGIALAHRRLSILDLSPAGHQPMTSASGRWVLAFNGEVYNHLELRSELDAKGAVPVWRGHSDTETLLAAIETWGPEAALRRSVGMFAIALWDRQGRELWLARDRLGEKPLYYGWQSDTFLFGSELHALRAHPAFTAGINRGSLVLLLRHNYVPAPYSIHSGIHKLPPGHWLRLGSDRRDAEPVAYWSLAEVAERGTAAPFTGSDEQAVDRLAELMGASVRGQMVADVPLGALLSGGIDSTLVTALMQLQATQPVRTFTIGFDERAYDEAVHARTVAKYLGTDHTELRLTGADALALVPRLPAMYDEPFADSSQLPTHLVMQLARQHVTVALSGDGGDEFFSGYNRYFLGPKLWRRVGWMPVPLRDALFRLAPALPHALRARLGAAQADDKLHKLARVFSGYRITGIDDLYCGLVSEWSDAGDMVVDGRVPPNLLDDRNRWPRLSDPVERMMALDGLTYLPDDILVKVDRAAMAVSLETRAPFLDRDVVEFAWSLPMAMKLRDGRGKWILRQLLDRHVPRELVERPKMGFGIPLDDWLRGPLRDWAEALLDEGRLRREGYLQPEPIREAWKQHQGGQASFGYRLWSVLMFQAWLERQGPPG
ncbi:MAG: asparagine synthase (glutamine-hydrolyzing) [Xanthomonadales bacterium]|nr:asparagine synthase (glutamine-hydrolyzing) [Xanthomonadales bacterium]